MLERIQFHVPPSKESNDISDKPLEIQARIKIEKEEKLTIIQQEIILRDDVASR